MANPTAEDGIIDDTLSVNAEIDRIANSPLITSSVIKLPTVTAPVTTKKSTKKKVSPGKSSVFIIITFE